MKRFESDTAWTMAFTNLKASVHSSQPIKVGGAAGADRRTLFLQWAKKRPEAGDLAINQALDRN